MFAGHFGVAFAAKALEPSVPLAGYMLSTQLLDVAWSSFVLTGVEKMRLTRGFTETNDLDIYYMPYSHGLPAAIAWSALAGAATFTLLPGAPPAAILMVALVCFSHWLLDLLVHRPDLPLWGDRYKVGFGLWNSRELAQFVELAIFCAGATMYLLSVRPPLQPIGLWWFGVILSCVLAVVQIASVYGPTPKSERAVAGSALASYVLVTALCYGAEVWFGGR